jgi:hypothetical protein
MAIEETDTAYFHRKADHESKEVSSEASIHGNRVDMDLKQRPGKSSASVSKYLKNLRSVIELLAGHRQHPEWMQECLKGLGDDADMILIARPGCAS